jgi:hypothetical protein
MTWMILSRSKRLLPKLPKNAVVKLSRSCMVLSFVSTLSLLRPRNIHRDVVPAFAFLVDVVALAAVILAVVADAEKQVTTALSLGIAKPARRTFAAPPVLLRRSGMSSRTGSIRLEFRFQPVCVCHSLACKQCFAQPFRGVSRTLHASKWPTTWKSGNGPEAA